MKNQILAAGVAVLALATAGQAATVIYTSGTVGPLNTSFTNVPLNLQQFDPTLGTLTGISITLNGSVNSTIRFESLDGQPSTIVGTSAATVTLSRPGGSPIVVTLPTQTRTANVAAFDGTIDFGGASGATFSDVIGTQSETAVLTSAGDFALFTGTGFVAALLSATGNSSVSGAGNLISQIATQASGQASITYTYDALVDNGVPEPMSWAMMTGGFALIGGALRRQRTRVRFA